MTKTEALVWKHLVFCCEWIAAIAGIWAWKQVRHTWYKYFVAYLLFIAIGDISAHYTGVFIAKPIRTALYNWLLIPTQFLCLYWFYYRCFTKPLYKKYCVAFAVFSIVLRILEFTVWENANFSFSSLSYLISSVFLFALIMMYLVQFMRSDDIVHYHRNFSFWVTLGLLVYYLGTFPLFAFYNYLTSVEKDFFYVYWRVQMGLNMLMYLIFSFAIIWTGIKHKYLYYS